jgi:hypothetical protein
MDRRKLRYLERDLPYCLFGQHKSYMDWPETEPRSPWWGAGDNYLSCSLSHPHILWYIFISLNT